MAYPITDKGTVITTTGASPPIPSVRIERKRSGQARPYNLPADYRNAKRSILGSGTYLGASANAFYAPWYVAVPHKFSSSDEPVQTLLLSARERFVGKVGSAANFAVAFAERESSIRMMTDRFRQLLKFCGALRKLRFREAASVLEIPVWNQPRAVSRSFSKNFLEWHFGWSPMLQDIHNACELLSTDFGPNKAKGVAGDVVVQASGAISPGQWRDFGRQSYEVKTFVRGGFRVTNPNLYLASQLGLTNPALVAWELVPFSFVVDWFANVSNFLGQFSELHGITLEEPYHGWKISSAGSYSMINLHPSGIVGEVLGSVGSTLHQFERIRGLPAVPLVFNRGKILSISRAVTACALLIQLGIRGR